MSRSAAAVSAITAALEEPIVNPRYVPRSAAATGDDASRIMATSLTRWKQRNSNVYQLSLRMFNGASAALFPAFGNRRGRHRAGADGHVDGTEGRSAHCAPLPRRQGVPFVGARNQLPRSVGIGKVLETGRNHMRTV